MAGPEKRREVLPDVEKGKKQTPAKSDHDDDCRCKETAQMKPGQLLRVMMNDLAFWRKPKKD